MPEPEMLYEASGRCSNGGHCPPFARSQESYKDGTLYYAAKKMAIPQRHPDVRQNYYDDAKSRDLTDTSLYDVDDLSVFMERSSQENPKTCLAQASGAPAWRHLVAVWQDMGRSRRQHDDAHDLGITVSATMNYWHLRCLCMMA